MWCPCNCWQRSAPKMGWCIDRRQAHLRHWGRSSPWMLGSKWCRSVQYRMHNLLDPRFYRRSAHVCHRRWSVHKMLGCQWNGTMQCPNNARRLWNPNSNNRFQWYVSIIFHFVIEQLCLVSFPDIQFACLSSWVEPFFCLKLIFGECSDPFRSHASSSCGEAHTCAVRAEATVVCWGSNVYNQSSVPTSIPYFDSTSNPPTMKTAPFKFSSCFPGFSTKLSEIVGSWAEIIYRTST